jgi:hypothetical protein
MVNQRDSSQRKKFVTFMILPHNSMREVVRINLPDWLAKVLLGFLIILVLTIAGFFIYSSAITTRLIHYYALQAENKLQEQQIKAFFDKTKQLESGIKELEERDQELREMLGLQKPAQKTLKLNSISNPFELKEKMAALDTYIQKKKEEYSLLKEASTALFINSTTILLSHRSTA